MPGRSALRVGCQRLPLCKNSFFKKRAGPRFTGVQNFPGLCMRTLAVPWAFSCVFLYAKNPGRKPGPLRAGCPTRQKLDFAKNVPGPVHGRAAFSWALCHLRRSAGPSLVCVGAKNPARGPGPLMAGCPLLQKIDFAKSVPGPDSWASNISWALCHHRLVQAGLPLVCVCVCVCVSSSSTRAGPVAGRVDNSPKTRFCK